MSNIQVDQMDTSNEAPVMVLLDKMTDEEIEELDLLESRQRSEQDLRILAHLVAALIIFFSLGMNWSSFDSGFADAVVIFLFARGLWFAWRGR